MRKITENFATFGNTPSLKQSTTYIEGYEYFEDYGTGQQSQTLSLIDEGRRFVMFESSVNPDYNLIRYQHPNHQGSCTLETDDTGNIITYEEYHPFGTTSYQATNASITAAAKRYRFTGMERDEETGLNYHNARYYIPWLGRWLNPDPIGIGDGVNVYAYCHNDPINGTDTSGTQNNKKVEPKQTNGQPFINLNTTLSKNADAASLRAAGTTADGTTVDLGKPQDRGSFAFGLMIGIGEGGYNTAKFAKSLTTAQGWKDVGTGVLNTAKSLNPVGEEGKQIRHQVVQGVRDYVKSLDTKSNFELGRDVGVGLEKLGEALLLKKGVDVALRARTPFKGLGALRDPAVTPKKGENILIDAKQGLQSSTKAQFENVVAGKVNDPNTKYLFTIDERGINIALEQTSAPTDRKFITHTNISAQAASGGEAWFIDKNTVSLNPKSARFGGGSITKEQWEATVKAWESLGYKVEAAEFTPPPKTPLN